MKCTFFFFFNDTATTEIYTLSLHDALPIYAVNQLVVLVVERAVDRDRRRLPAIVGPCAARERVGQARSEEHTSELQSPCNLVCRLLLEKKKKNHFYYKHDTFYLLLPAHLLV